MAAFRFAVDVMPRDGILDPQGRAVEAALPRLGATSVHEVRVGRRIELTVEAESEGEASEVVHRLAGEFLANPLIESWVIESLASTPAGVGVPA
ncbi:MAG TPA: phosphoribosylformylglycinamidine synthase subunit PurS [Candidatus Limnocylindrales bacterium]|nr:phosphoribosylformylglycinamidine synthase subunit PurS [Candidatus Limnocylindrales bacterium]